MRKIAVVTGTRAEYGLLYWILKAIERDIDLELQLIVTGAHLSHVFGHTVDFILKDGFKVAKQIDVLMSSDSQEAISKSIGIAVMGLSQTYSELKPDLLLVLGDRYEILAAVCAALPFNIPIAHIHGGEVTEGAIDEQIRHAITKMSHIHFASTKIYADNIISMGENPANVHFVGAPALEWHLSSSWLSKQELGSELEIDFNKPYIIATFHPVTTELDHTEIYVESLIKALTRLNMRVIFTGANADSHGSLINARLQKESLTNQNFSFVMNLGSLRYFSCLKYASALVGNSSSGIIEAGFFDLPAVNIGTRQRGRIAGSNVIHVGYDEMDIYDATKKALSTSFRNSIDNLSNPYGNGHVSERVVTCLKNVDLGKLFVKRFYNQKNNFSE